MAAGLSKRSMKYTGTFGVVSVRGWASSMCQPDPTAGCQISRLALRLRSERGNEEIVPETGTAGALTLRATVKANRRVANKVFTENILSQARNWKSKVEEFEVKEGGCLLARRRQWDCCANSICRNGWCWGL